MSSEPEEVVKVAYGELVEIQMYQRALEDAGIESKVVGQDLDASFGSALLDSMELWVRAADAERARAAIDRLEQQRGKGEPPHGPQQSDRRPE
jgi:hypothetical protein